MQRSMGDGRLLCAVNEHHISHEHMLGTVSKILTDTDLYDVVEDLAEVPLYECRIK